jgi:hypothetical protein
MGAAFDGQTLGYHFHEDQLQSQAVKHDNIAWI